MLTTDSLVILLAAHPDGMTSDDVALATGRKLDCVTGRLSKLAAYGLIRKERFKTYPAGTRAKWFPKVRT